MRKQAVSLVASRLVAALAQAALFVLVARDLGPSDFGVLGAVLSMVTLAVLFASFGSAQVVLRDRAVGDGASVAGALSLGSATSMLLFAAAIIIVLASAVSGTVAGSLGMAGFVLAALSLEKSADVRLSLLIADGRRLAPAANVVLRRLTALTGYIAVTRLAMVDEAMLVFGGAYLAGGVVGALHAWACTRDSRGLPLSRSVLVKAARSSWPFLSNNLTTQGRTLDVVIIAAIAGAHEAGLYAAAYRLASPLLIVTSGVASALVPFAVAAGRDGAPKIARSIVLWHLLAAVVVCVGALVGAPLFTVLLGEEYEGATGLLVVLAGGMVLIGLGTLLGSLLQANERAGYVSAVGVGFLVALLAVVSLALVATQSAMAAAVGVAGVYLAKVIAMFRATARLPANSVPADDVAVAAERR